MHAERSPSDLSIKSLSESAKERVRQWAENVDEECAVSGMRRGNIQGDLMEINESDGDEETSTLLRSNPQTSSVRNQERNENEERIDENEGDQVRLEEIMCCLS